MKRCKKCQEWKALEQFHVKKNSPDGRQPACADCTNVLQRARHTKGAYKRENSHIAEKLALEALQANGIFATKGRWENDQKWRDVVAFGCIRIEVKSASNRNNLGYSFKLYTNSYNNFYSNHFVLLVALEAKPRFFLFSPFHATFHRDGRLKSAIAYNPNAKRHHNDSSMTNQIMLCHENQWGWITALLQDMVNTGDYAMENRMYGL